MIEKMSLLINIDPQTFFNQVEEAVSSAQQDGFSVDVQYSTTTIITFDGEKSDNQVQHSALLVMRKKKIVPKKRARRK